ncbi:DUF6172 family protein [Candidatus Thioglobus sp.]|nr:DUF6172 family protein [Candidatus Thioglobus sp.]
MKKTFELIHPKIKPARLIETARRDIKKYLKRENRKLLPDDFDCWNFDCKFGPSEEKAEVILSSEISKCISEAEAESLKSFYLEILAKPGYKKSFAKLKALDKE